MEYSAFFGSMQVFQYLFNNEIGLTSSLWMYAIHGNNPELIHFLEKNQIEPPKADYKKCFMESIKCHHNEIANYILNMFLQNNDLKSLNQCLKNYNFALLADEFKDNLNSFYKCNQNDINEEDKNVVYNLFNELCKYDYLPIVENLLKLKGMDINSKTIFFVI